MVMTGSGELVEIVGTAESAFNRSMDQLLDLASLGEVLINKQREAMGKRPDVYLPSSGQAARCGLMKKVDSGFAQSRQD